MKKVFLALVASILLFVLTLTPIANETAQAATSLTLTSKDMTLWGIKPNEPASSAMKKMKTKYKQLDFTKVEDGYITGDSTPQMAYYLEFYTDSKGRVVGIEYDHFKAKNKGLNFATSKGIKVGSSITTVYKKYGKKPKEKTSKDPGYNYIDLSYPIVVKETKQTGTLTIKVRYGKKEKRSAAKVYGYYYKLKPLKTNEVNYQTTTTPHEFYDFWNRFETISSNGWGVDRGKTYNQVYQVLGKPLTITDMKVYGYPGVVQWTYQKLLSRYEVNTISYETVYFYNGKVISVDDLK